MEVVDLTMPLFDGMPGYPGDPAVAITRVRSHEPDGYQVTRISLGSHSGTHLDAPRHFFPQGAALDQYPAARLMGRGVVVDCRAAPDQGASEDSDGDQGTGRAQGRGEPVLIDAPTLAARLAPHIVPPGGFVLLWTEGALLGLDAAHILLETGPTLVGIDGPSIDAEPYPVHRLLLGHGVILAENLCGLERLGPGPVNCAFLPLSFPGADGAPVRAVAWH